MKQKGNEAKQIYQKKEFNKYKLIGTFFGNILLEIKKYAQTENPFLNCWTNHLIINTKENRRESRIYS